MTWSLYIDGEVYAITSNRYQALRMRIELEEFERWYK